MAELKEEIRNLLREELALMKDEFKLSETAVEQVVIRSNDDLMAFVDNILGRAADASFVRQIKEKTLRFELSEQLSMSTNSCTDRNLDDKKHVSIEKILITERDIGKLDNSEKAINIWKSSRLTPLARDEIRRRGIKIERIDK